MSETLVFFLNYKKLLKTYKKYNVIQNNLSKLIVFCEWKSKWVIHSKKEWIAHLLFYHERIAHSHSFVLSILKDSLMVALLSWATWALRSQLLICPERSEWMAHSCSLKLAILSKWAMSEWANSQPCKIIYNVETFSYRAY